MKLQIKVLGKVENISSTPTKITVYGKVTALELHNDACHDSYFKLPPQYASVVLVGKNLKFVDSDTIVVSGDINEIQFKDSKGQVVKQYYIPECVIQLIDVDQQPDDELFD